MADVTISLEDFDAMVAEARTDERRKIAAELREVARLEHRHTAAALRREADRLDREGETE